MKTIFKPRFNYFDIFSNGLIALLCVKFSFWILLLILPAAFLSAYMEGKIK